MKKSSRSKHLESNHHLNHSVKYEEFLSPKEWTLLENVRGMSSYDIYKKFGSQIDRTVRAIKKRIQFITDSRI